MIYRKLLAVVLVILVISTLLSFAGCLDEEQNSNKHSVLSEDITNGSERTEETDEGMLTVHYLDVGQGDSIFLEFPDESCMLIDASTADYGDDIVETIGEMGYERIDYVVATHPHADHIGGMQEVLNSFEIGCIYLPDVSASTNTYIKMAETILNLNIEAKVAEAGVVILEFSDMKAEFLAPSKINESDQNQNSAVMLLTYAETKFLFMGDADTEIEDSLGETVDCDVLKVGHHGSRTASGKTFLTNASPAYAIISCGEGNSYGHPHAEAMERLNASGATVLRTDLLGTIMICSDGTELSVYYGREEAEEPSKTLDDSGDNFVNAGDLEIETWVLNINSRKIHEIDCRHVSNIGEQNRLETDETLEELIEEGYSLCGTCKPGK